MSTLTKDQISDLKGFVRRIEETTIARLHAMMANDKAHQELENFLWSLEHEKTVVVKAGV